MSGKHTGWFDNETDDDVLLGTGGRMPVIHPDGFGSIGFHSFVVNVSDGSGDPVRSANVSLTRDGEILQNLQTNAFGDVIFYTLALAR